jgi:WD40 repeat protein
MGLTHMRRLLAAPFLAVVLSAQAQPQLVVSVGHADAPSHAVFAGSHLATASSSNVAFVDLSTGLTVAHLPQGSLVTSMEASPAEDIVAVGTCGHAIQLWDMSSRAPLRRIALRQECAESVSFSPDGALLATGAYGCCSTGGLQIWDVRTGALTRELTTGSGIRGVRFSGDGSWLAAIDADGKAIEFEWPSGRQLRTFDGLDGVGASESSPLSSPDGKYFAWLGFGHLQAWDVSTGAQIALPGARPVTISDRPSGGPERTWTEQQVTASAAEFLNDGRLAYVDGDRLLILTLPTGPMQEVPLEQPKIERLGDLGLVHSPSWLAIRQDGGTVAGTYESRTVLWDVAGRKLRELTSPALTDPGALE